MPLCHPADYPRLLLFPQHHDKFRVVQDFWIFFLGGIYPSPCSCSTLFFTQWLSVQLCCFLSQQRVACSELGFQPARGEGEVTGIPLPVLPCRQQRKPWEKNSATSHAPALQHLSAWSLCSARAGTNSHLTLALLS